MTTEFDDIIAGLELDDTTDIDNVRSVKELSDGELMLEYSSVKRELLASGEMLKNATSQHVRDLHSRRAALIIEMKDRSLT